MKHQPIASQLMWTISALLMIQAVSAQIPDTSTIIQNLNVPWEILWGPDDHIWCTERNGVVSRINPEDKTRRIIGTIGDVYTRSEAGLLGMALHPDFNVNPTVFLVYTYLSGTEIREKLVRYDYIDDSLINPKTLLSDIIGNANHNGSRLIVTNDKKLLMTTGDAQQQNTYPLDTASVNGKILRINLDGSVPSDNPFPGSYVFTWGHRNPQGLVQLPDGTIFSSEHGPSNDDEINRIIAKGNYGWPKVEGFCNTPTEQAYCQSTVTVEPVKSWSPTLAVAGLAYYDKNQFASWKNSLLLVTLKESDLRVLRLSDDHKSIVNEQVFFNSTWGRLRDVCVSPDGDVYVATSNRDGRAQAKTGDDRIVRLFTRGTTGTVTPGQTRQHISKHTYTYSNNTLFIQSPNDPEELKITITDFSGKVVYSSLKTNNAVNIRLSNGIYVITVALNRQGVQQDKLIISK